MLLGTSPKALVANCCLMVWVEKTAWHVHKDMCQGMELSNA